MARVIVIGAGVVGLSCAVRLLEAGHEVSVVARDLPLETTSAVAAALWYPHLPRALADEERVAGWAAATYAELCRLAGDQAGDGAAGVVVREGTDVSRGVRAAAPVVEMPVYLPWLTGRVESLGGTVTRMALSGLPDQAEVVVDAAGLGGRLFGEDPSVQPVRGQVVYVKQVGLEQWWLDPGESDAAGPAYVVPRSRDIVVGGTEEPDVWAPDPDPEVARRLLARAYDLAPELRGAPILGHRVGLSPARPSVRLEAARRGSGASVVHCYGHGGAGVTLSWGCADEVTALVGRS